MIPYQMDNGPMPDKTAARRALVRAHLTVEAAKAAEIVAVADARTAGVTWDEIAEDLGMKPGSSGNAHKKYAPHLEQVIKVKDRT